MRKNAILTWLFACILLGTIIYTVSSIYSKDYPQYLVLIQDGNASEPFLNFYSLLASIVGATPETTYFFYSLTVTAALAFFFISRSVKPFWIIIYALNFGLLHVVTQIRVCLASIFVAILLTSQNKGARKLIFLAPIFHFSAIIATGLTFANRNFFSLIPATVFPLIFIFTLPWLVANYDPVRLKALDYFSAENTSQYISLSFVTLSIIIIIALASRLSAEKKWIVMSLAILTICSYFYLISFYAISNRLAEFTSATLFLCFGSWDRIKPVNQFDPRTRLIFKPVFKITILAWSIFSFYYANIVNSVLNI